ncbi:pyridoxal-phosphate dependent enzyme [Lignipirellula cremea]|uniref:Phenylserine dehydratase n=1 Tax=Lignipirellula cremea TaxID=2528010 RepID=A0A518DMB5_9BACT|nr:pyridoxal-phosphate dependent enzyme [Lignipirellula cremea]QDU92961.1 Phenylserine dehydratase [Lignipirellula cremea]
MSTTLIDLAAVRAAAERIAKAIHRTPLETCAALDQRAGRNLYFKCEHLQKVGAFKFRGACNAVFGLEEEQARSGVATHSSGNHAQALALAARLRRIPAYVVMPSSASPVKRSAVEEYGGQVRLCEPTLEARETTARQVCEETGATFIHPYNDPAIIAGQGTTALELLEQAPQLEAIVAPIGGGGLISGIGAVLRELAPHVRLIGAEPAGADDAARSKAAGELLLQTNPQTICDGLLTSLGSLTWPFVRDTVERVETVTEQEIVLAMRLAWQRAKLLIEPSSAAAVAVALRAFRHQPEIQHVGVVLSGGNVNLDQLPW